MPRTFELKGHAEEDDSCRFHCCDCDIADEYCVTCGMFFKACRSPFHPDSPVDLALCRPRSKENAMMQCGFFIIYAVIGGCLILGGRVSIAVALTLSSAGAHPMAAFLMVMIWFYFMAAAALVIQSIYVNMHMMWFATAVKHGCVFCFCCCGTGQLWIAILGGLDFLAIATDFTSLLAEMQIQLSSDSPVEGIGERSRASLSDMLVGNPMVLLSISSFFLVLELYYATYVIGFFCDVRNGNVKNGAKKLVGEAVQLVSLDDAFEEETESETESGLIQ